MRRNLQPRKRNDDGFTLIETMVAVGLFSLLTIMLCSITILGMRVSSGLSNRLENATQSSLAVDAISKALRTAVLPEQLTDQQCSGCSDTALVKATRSQVSFYANLNNRGDGPSLITYKVIKDPYSTQNTAMLVQTMQPPTVLGAGRYTFCTAGTSGCVTRDRVLARGLDLPAANIFGYYNNDGELITTPTLTDSDLASVTSVEVNFRVQTVRGRGDMPSTTMVKRIRLPNSDINVFIQPDSL